MYCVGNACQCASSWVSQDDGGICAEEQHGCANCDGDVDGSWCIVDNPGCSTDEGDGWSYCGEQNYWYMGISKFSCMKEVYYGKVRSAALSK